jgi:hypothetical protein
MDRRSRWLAAIPAFFLVAVATVQIALARLGPLSPWKGGGFGMFASLDGGSFRTLRVFVEAPERSEEILLPPSLRRLGAEVEAFPSDGMVARLADAVADREREAERSVLRVRVDVWRTEYAPRSLEPSRRLLREHAMEVASRAP